jgi:hypothetical protein
MKKLKPRVVDWAQIDRFLASADKKPASARKILAFDEEACLQQAYEAMLKASLGFMFSHGFRARSQPLNLLLLKTAIPANAPCVHEMDMLICKLAGAVGIETAYRWHSNDLSRTDRSEKEGLGSRWSPYCRLNAASFPVAHNSAICSLLSVLLACRCSWSFECPHSSTRPAELSHPLRAHATSTKRRPSESPYAGCPRQHER